MPIFNHVSLNTSKQADPKALALLGAILPIEVHVPKTVVAHLSKTNQPMPQPFIGHALVDTGATMTCVNDSILTQLGLNPVSTATMGTANGPVQQNIYPARLFFPAQGWDIEFQTVVGVNLSGQSIPSDPPVTIDVLIGRNLLMHWLLVWNGPMGVWSIAM